MKAGWYEGSIVEWWYCLFSMPTILENALMHRRRRVQNQNCPFVP